MVTKLKFRRLSITFHQHLKFYYPSSFSPDFTAPPLSTAFHCVRLLTVVNSQGLDRQFITCRTLFILFNQKIRAKQMMVQVCTHLALTLIMAWIKDQTKLETYMLLGILCGYIRILVL